MNREARIADKLVKTAAWMATGYYKDLSGRSSWIGHGCGEASRMTHELLRMLSSPIEDDEMGTVITKVRGLKATLGSLQDAVTQQHIAMTTLYDELRRRVGL